MAEWAQKVFWTDVDVVQDGADFKILLDGRGIKTPAKSPLHVPTHKLAMEIAAEWRALENKVDPEKLPLTKLANAAIDKVSVQSELIIEMLAEYATTDLLCYRATSPAKLVSREEQIWQPLLEWFEDVHGIKLQVGSGVMPIQQVDNVLGACTVLLKRFSSFELAAVYDLITLSGSFVIGLAVAGEKVTVSDAWAASRIDEDWQIQEWGTDQDASALAATRQNAFEQAAFVLTLLK